MNCLNRISSGWVLALATVCLVGIVSAISGGKMFSPGALNAQGSQGRMLGGVASHAEIGGNCSACHAAPWSNAGMATRCLDCHAEVRRQLDARLPLHGTLSPGMPCRSCHTEHNGPHAALTSLDQFDHDWTAFKLTGKHRSVDCQSCHAGNVYRGTSQSCVTCHAEPQVHKGRFGTNCAQCHSTSTWADATFSSTGLAQFDHDRTAFKLTGKHKTVDCKSCHVNNVFKGTSQTCVSCHAEPLVHKGAFGTQCASCHSTRTWAGATLNSTGLSQFDHDRTAFKLTGKHKTVDCKSCHVNNVFKGTAQTCVSCHAEPQVHKERFGTSCAQCHSTNTWQGATFKHTFPLNHGHKQRVIACATCHAKPNDMRAYTCYGCHEHQPAKIEQKHLNKGIKDFQQCVHCHPTGREREQRRRAGSRACPKI